MASTTAHLPPAPTCSPSCPSHHYPAAFPFPQLPPPCQITPFLHPPFTYIHLPRLDGLRLAVGRHYRTRTANALVHCTTYTFTGRGAPRFCHSPIPPSSYRPVPRPTPQFLVEPYHVLHLPLLIPPLQRRAPSFAGIFALRFADTAHG